MRRTAILAVLLLFACHEKVDEHADHTAPTTTTTAVAETPTATAAPQPAPSAGTSEKFGDGASGYLALPAGGPAKKPAIIVIQEWWGLDDWIRQQTDRFAQQGYVALAVDLYRGKSTKSPEEAHELMRGLPPSRGVADLKAAVDYLSSRADVDPQRIGVIGWCMGGGYALSLATSDPRPKATVINYGHLETDAKAITKIQGQILGNFGGADRGIPAEDVKKFGADLTKYGKLADIKVYDGAGHAFMNPNNTQGYNAAAAQDAWSRIDAFFERNLRANMPNS
ncbi:MAG TPA: dienelactone hydrolase family protein [Thermoanaerobaculia bacterium]|nr:dienelactone hydrolase family protein [Thermoanaerobaculia bacterium]